MPLTQRILQFGIVTLGVSAAVYAILKMSETETMILPIWLLITPVVVFMCIISYGLGAAIKHLFHSDFHSITFTSMVVIFFVGIYAALEYKPTIKITIANGYTGEVKLFVSNDSLEDHKILVNNFGVGYITKKDFDNGFYPKIVCGSDEITKSIKEYSKGTFLSTTPEKYSFNYLSFIVPGGSKDSPNDIDYLVKIGALDTLRLPFVSLHHASNR